MVTGMAVGDAVRRTARRLVTVAPGPRRWPVAVRAAISVAGPATVGLLCGDLASGLLATIGAFTALYGNDRPYLNRGIQLAVIAVCFALFVAAGDAAAAVPFLGVLTIAAVAAVSVLVCNALVVGPPGAYMFVLACAAGTGVAAAHLSPWHTGVLVLAGGAFAWLVQMSGVAAGPRRPERRAVAAAGEATAAYAEAMGTDGETRARHQAADALHRAWQILVNFQSGRDRRGGALPALRAANLRLHVLFAQLMASAAGQRPMPADAATQARRLAQHEVTVDDGVDVDDVPLGRPGVAELLRRALAPGASARSVAIRTGVAALLAGALAATLGVDHAYWAASAAVLVLHQGFDRRRTIERTVERVVGTAVGLGVAGLVFAWQPQGVWLVLVLAALQFVVELLVVRNYALAVVFITPLALTISAGGRPVSEVAHLLAARGVDTVIGCGLAVLVYLLVAHRSGSARLEESIATTLEQVADVAAHVDASVADTASARVDRRDLQVHILAMVTAYDAGAAGSRRERTTAERLWPAVVATQDLAYRMLAACWGIERGEITSGTTVFGLSGAASLRTELRALAVAVRTGDPPARSSDTPQFGAAEIGRLRESLVGG